MACASSVYETHGVARIRLLAQRERAEFAEALAASDAQQWIQSSLCDGWSVRDVVAHTVAYLGQSRPVLAANMIRARGRIDRFNSRGLEEMKSAEPGRLVELVRRGSEPDGVGALYGCRVALIECLVREPVVGDGRTNRQSAHRASRRRRVAHSIEVASEVRSASSPGSEVDGAPFAAQN